MKYLKQSVLTGVVFIVLTVLSWQPAQGQLKVGDILPANRMEELKKLSSPDFPASSEPFQLYLIDFWSRWCGSCIASFPKVEGLQYQYRNEIRILAINPWNDNEEIRDLFDKMNGVKKAEQKSENGHLEVIPYVPSVIKPRMTSLPASYGDKTWLDLFEIKGVPHYVWVNNKGRILAITGPNEVRAGNINHYLLNKALPKMTFKSFPDTYNLSKVSLTDVWGMDVFPYQENGLKIREFYDGVGGSVYGYDKLGVVDSVKKTIRYSFVNTPIADLYKAAWSMGTTEHNRINYNYGKPFIINADTVKFADVLGERVLWEVSQPEYYIGPLDENFVSSGAPGFNEWSFRAKFCAELELPLQRKKEASDILLKGLNKYFSQKLGISAKIETRKRACLVLKKKENYHPLTSKTKKASHNYDPQLKAEIYHNYPFNNIVLDFLPYRIKHNSRDQSWTTNSGGNHYMTRMNRNLPLIDETGISENVDITLHVIPDEITNPLDAMNARLKGTGLHFVKELRDIKMLVISDNR